MVLKIILVVVVELVVVETVVVDTLVVVVAVVAVVVAIVVVIVVAVVIVVVIVVVVVVVVVVVGTYWLDCSSFIWMKMTFLSSCAVNSCVTAKSNYRIQNYDKKICMCIENVFFLNLSMFIVYLTISQNKRHTQQLAWLMTADIRQKIDP